MPPKILIIDDDSSLRRVLEYNLQQEGYDVVTAADGESGLRLFAEKFPALVITDLKMPGMDGIETLREIKKKKPLVEVIMLTGHASVESGIQGMQLGAFDYVMKPVALDELLEKVRQAYDRKVIQEGKA